MLHIVNSAAVPVDLTKSYSAYAGAADAMVQWWYGHNAVGFFLTAGFLGMMYYFVPKQAVALFILPALYCSLLGVDFSVYLGRLSPFALFCVARLSTKSGHGNVVDFTRPVGVE